MKMKRSEVIGLLNTIDNVLPLSKKVKFNYALLKNKKILEAEQEIIKEVLKPSDAFMEFDQKRIDVCKKHADKDENGEVIINDDVFSGLEN
ncbi:MAG: hypothetical protein ACOC2U_03490, partial [bacterium]